jgi:translation elongation factor EF-1alpha
VCVCVYFFLLPHTYTQTTTHRLVHSLPTRAHSLTTHSRSLTHYPLALSHSLPTRALSLTIHSRSLTHYPLALSHSLAQSINEPATITRLYAILDKQIKKRPRALGDNVMASVRITPSRPICLELYSEFRQLGRVMLRDRGRTIAAGIVVELTRVDQ